MGARCGVLFGSGCGWLGEWWRVWKGTVEKNRGDRGGKGMGAIGAWWGGWRVQWVTWVVYTGLECLVVV